MIGLKYFSAVLLTFSLASANVISPPNTPRNNALEKLNRWGDLGTTANINDYVDETLALVIPLIRKNGLDPMALPEIVEGFEVKPVLITYSAWLKIHDGYMTGLVNIARDGDQTVSYFANMLRIKLKLKFRDLQILYNFLVQVMKIGPTGKIQATLDSFSVAIDVLLDFNNDEIQLQQFELLDTGKLKAKLSGNILTDWLVNPLINVFLRIFNDVIIKIVEANILSSVQEVLDNLNSNFRHVITYLESFDKLRLKEHMRNYN